MLGNQKSNVPRISSSARLNNYSSPLPQTPTGLANSFPSTNTSKPSSMANTTPNHIYELETYNNLTAFESTLSEFSASVSKFKPDTALLQELVRLDSALKANTKELVDHQKYGEQLQSITDQLDDYDADLKNILKGLVECRNDLRALPALNADHLKNETSYPDISATELLKYAMKLAKFTVAPPTFDVGSIGPNDFIWPSEGALRKGMLASASIHADELIGEKKISTEEVGDEEEKPKETEEENIRRSSFGSYDGGHHDSISANALADLDLFDPDESD